MLELFSGVQHDTEGHITKETRWC